MGAEFLDVDLYFFPLWFSSLVLCASALRTLHTAVGLWWMLFVTEYCETSRWKWPWLRISKSMLFGGFERTLQVSLWQGDHCWWPIDSVLSFTVLGWASREFFSAEDGARPLDRAEVVRFWRDFDMDFSGNSGHRCDLGKIRFVVF